MRFKNTLSFRTQLPGIVSPFILEHGSKRNVQMDIEVNYTETGGRLRVTVDVSEFIGNIDKVIISLSQESGCHDMHGLIVIPKHVEVAPHHSCVEHPESKMPLKDIFSCKIGDVVEQIVSVVLDGTTPFVTPYIYNKEGRQEFQVKLYSTMLGLINSMPLYEV